MIRGHEVIVYRIQTCDTPQMNCSAFLPLGRAINRSLYYEIIRSRSCSPFAPNQPKQTLRYFTAREVKPRRKLWRAIRNAIDPVSASGLVDGSLSVMPLVRPVPSWRGLGGGVAHVVVAPPWMLGLRRFKTMVFVLNRLKYVSCHP